MSALIGVSVVTALGPVVLMLASMVTCRYIQCLFVQGFGGNAEVQELMNYITNNATIASSYTREKPYGLVIGKCFIAYIADGDEGRMIWLYRRYPKQAARPDKQEEVRAEITTCERWMHKNGSGYDLIKRYVPVAPSAQQHAAVDRIIAMAKQSRANGYGYNVAVYIHGPPGCGKSTIGAMVALRINGTLCDTHMPLDAGDTLSMVVVSAEATEEKPLVLVINEFNRVVESAFDRPGEFRYKGGVPSVCSQSSYNDYMDRLCTYNGCIFVFTSNLTRTAVEQRYPSSLRDGRINMEIALTQDGEVSALAAKRFMPTPPVSTPSA